MTVRIGDPAVYADGPEMLRGSIGVARAFDDKAGAYVCMEAFRRLAKEKSLAATVASVATTQEEIGVRGAQVAAGVAAVMFVGIIVAALVAIARS